MKRTITCVGIVCVFAGLSTAVAQVPAELPAEGQVDAPKPKAGSGEPDTTTDSSASQPARAAEGAAAHGPTEIQRDSKPDHGSGGFSNAPTPDRAGGVKVDREKVRRWWLRVPRALLFVPRWAIEVPFAVPRFGLWAYERYELKARYIRFFFNDSERIGLYPALFFETGFGFNGGVRFVHRDLFGSKGKLRLRAGFGGLYRQVYSGELRTGSLFGRFEVKARAEYVLSPRKRFFGIGNGNIVETDVMNVDPLTDDTAVSTRFRTSGTVSKLSLVQNFTESLTVSLSGALKTRQFDDSERDGDISTSSTYDVSRLVGYADGLSNLYGELDVTFDNRRRTRDYLSKATPATGWRLSGFGGGQSGLSGDPSKFFRWGIDVQRNVDLYGGDRYLVLRGFVDSVVGDLDDVPFVDLPSLGGPLLLRGYPRDRFRDRHAALVSFEYNYPIIPHANGFAFVDVGTVWRVLDEIEESQQRVGFGAGVQFHSLRQFAARAFVASSSDGGLLFSVSFDPVFDARSREDRP